VRRVREVGRQALGIVDLDDRRPRVVLNHHLLVAMAVKRPAADKQAPDRGDLAPGALDRGRNLAAKRFQPGFLSGGEALRRKIHEGDRADGVIICP